MKKADFIRVIDSAIKQGKNIKVYVRMPDCHSHEVICNPPENLIAKKSYYQRSYSSDMELASFPAIRIDNIEITDTL